MKTVVITRQPETFCEEFLNALRQSMLVGIHGRNSSGKTRLAKDLIPVTGGTHIEVDDFLSQPRDGRTYLEQVKEDELIKKILTSARPVFLDSFIVLDVLEKINKQADYFIFCDRLTDESSFRFNQENEGTFDSYEERRNPRAAANKIFTFNMFWA